MPKDEDNDRVFDVSKPNKISPSPTSKPIIVGHHPMMSDPMVKEDKVDSHPELPKSGHKTIKVLSDGEQKEDTKPEAHDESVEPPQHKEDPGDVSPTLAPALASVEAQPLHPESVEAVASPAGDAVKPAAQSADGDMHLTSLDDMIGHEHHEHGLNGHHKHAESAASQPHTSPKGGSKKLSWLLVLVLVFVAAYLVIDSRLIKTSINLPFHVFKQPAPATDSTTTTQQSAGSVSTNPPAGLSSYTLDTTADKTVSFNYPTIWGTPTETTESGFSSRSKSATSDGTYAYLVNFATNKDVQIVLTSGKYLPPARATLYYDYLQWCVGTNDGKIYKSELHFSTSAGVDTPTTTTCDQGPLSDATKLDSGTIVQLKTTNPDGSLLGDLYTENLDDELNLPVLRVKDAAMTNSVAIKALLASLKLVDNQSATPASQ